MGSWILLVFLTNGKTIGTPFDTEKECKQAIEIMAKKLKGDKNIVRLECAEGSIEEDKPTGKSDAYI